MEATEILSILAQLWPMLVAFVLLIVTLAQSHYRIKVLEEKMQSAYDLIKKINERMMQSGLSQLIPYLIRLQMYRGMYSPLLLLLRVMKD